MIEGASRYAAGRTLLVLRPFWALRLEADENRTKHLENSDANKF